MKKLLIGMLVCMLVMILMTGLLLVRTLSDSPARRYEAAEALMMKGEYKQAADAFDALAAYSDAQRMAMYCRAADAGECGSYADAREAFAALGDFRDSALMARYYQARRHQDNGTLSSLTTVSDAELAGAKNSLSDAVTVFAEIRFFKDSSSRADTCRSLIASIDKEQTACAEAKKKAEEEAARKKAEEEAARKKAEEEAARKKAEEEAARKKAEEEAAEEAAKKKAAEEAAKKKAFVEKAAMANVQMVDNDVIVTFGRYPQTEDGNDETPIEWLVLDCDETNNRVLLISRYGLDAKPYNNEYVDITWEQCTLRTWLNQDFLNKAFTSAEQSAILMTNVDNSKSQGCSGWDTNGGNNTQDRIFLLSYAEANKYFGVQPYSVSGSGNNMKSRMTPTAYALKNGASTSGSNNMTAEGTAVGWWWLRSPGGHQDRAADVTFAGSLDYGRVRSFNACVRPAFWLNLDSDIF